jgi:hypothetical protein
LLIQPFVEITGWTATGDHGEAFFVQTLADRGSDATHATCDVRYFFAHFLSPDL